MPWFADNLLLHTRCTWCPTMPWSSYFQLCTQCNAVHRTPVTKLSVKQLIPRDIQNIVSQVIHVTPCLPMSTKHVFPRGIRSGGQTCGTSWFQEPNTPRTTFTNRNEKGALYIKVCVTIMRFLNPLHNVTAEIFNTWTSSYFLTGDLLEQPEHA